LNAKDYSEKSFRAGRNSAICWTTLFFDYRLGRAGRRADRPAADIRGDEKVLSGEREPGIQRVSEYL